MATKVFYFTTTGNSLAFARNLAAGLGETELISIAKAIGNPARACTDGAERVGLTFPVLVWGAPPTVVDFVRQLKVSDSQYVFAIATCGGTPGNTVRNIGKLLRAGGGHLDAGFTVREPAYFEGGGGPNRLIEMVRRAARGVTPGPGSERLTEITAAIHDFRRHSPEVSPWVAGFLGDLFHGMSAKMIRTADRNYSVDEHCTGCGICERVCPRANVRLVAGRPTWHGDCQLCQTCFQWCPQAAIQMGEATKGAPRNHRSGVTVDDMLVR